MADQKFRSAAAVASEPAPARPAAPAAGGHDYLVSEAHYASLARRVLASVRGGSRIVLVTGDPKPNPLTLSAALTHAAKGEYELFTLSSALELGGDRLRSASGRPLFVFEDAERLTDGQLADIYDYFISGDCVTAAGVLPAAPELSTRLQRLKAAAFDEMSVARLNIHELGREEIESFIRRQLPPGEEMSALTPEAIDGIADFAGGDPAQVNRLARLMLDFPHWGGSHQERSAADSVGEPSPGVRPRRHLAAWAAASIAVLLFAAASVVIKSALEEPSLPQTAAEPPALPTPIDEARPVEVASAPAETIPSGEVQQAISPPAEAAVPAEPPTEQGDTPEPTPPETAAPVAVEPRLSAEQLEALIARGEAGVQMCDLTSARLYFERAAEAGDGRAALRLGETFDPTFLGRAGIRGAQADRQQAVSWYRRARDLGNADAARLLETVESQDQGRVSR